MTRGRNSHIFGHFAAMLTMLCSARADALSKTFLFYDASDVQYSLSSDKVLFDNKVPCISNCAQLCTNRQDCVSFTFVTDDVITSGCASGRCLGYSSSLRSLTGSPALAADARTYNMPVNVAAHKAASQSSTVIEGYAGLAVDGNWQDTNFALGSCTHTNGAVDRWWQVDLAGVYDVFSVALTNRATSGERLRELDIELYQVDSTTNAAAPASLCLFHPGPVGHGATEDLPCVDAPVRGRFVRVTPTDPTSSYLTLCEVQVMALPAN